MRTRFLVELNSALFPMADNSASLSFVACGNGIDSLSVIGHLICLDESVAPMIFTFPFAVWVVSLALYSRFSAVMSVCSSAKQRQVVDSNGSRPGRA
jgi:hypothetical protein